MEVQHSFERQSELAAGVAASRSLMAEPMALDTLKLASTAGLAGWLANIQRQTPEVAAFSTAAFASHERQGHA